MTPPYSLRGPMSLRLLGFVLVRVLQHLPRQLNLPPLLVEINRCVPDGLHDCWHRSTHRPASLS